MKIKTVIITLTVLAVIVALAIVLVVSKPNPKNDYAFKRIDSDGPVAIQGSIKNLKPDDFSRADGRSDTALNSNGEDSNRAANASERKKPKRPDIMQGPHALTPDKPLVVATAMDNPYRDKQVSKHGDNPVLTPIALFTDDILQQDYPLQTPNWKKPLHMDFLKLRQVYRQFSLMKGHFSDYYIKTLHGAAVVLSGAIMPIDEVKKDGALRRFWIANPRIVMAGCVFCNAPSFGDLVLVDAAKNPVVVDREELYSKVMLINLLGRFTLGPYRTGDGVTTLFRMEVQRKVD